MKIVLGTASVMNYKQAKNGANRLVAKAEGNFEAATDESAKMKESKNEKENALVVKVRIHAHYF